jgi:putative tryptophan/tyrosine transport system substrate-binding protein
VKIGGRQWLVVCKSIFAVALGAMLFGLCASAHAQQPEKRRRIGFLIPASLSVVSVRTEAFQRGLRDLGYVEGQNATIEWRSAEGKLDRLTGLAAELVRLKVDIIVAAGGDPPVRAAKQATHAIPIVMANASDPVGAGLVASLNNPGGNVTGLSTAPGPEIYGKHLELLKETFPKLSRVAILSNPANQFSALALRETETTARAFKVSLQILEARNPDEFDTAFAAATKERAGALLVVEDPMFFGERTRLANLATKSRLPAIYGILEYVEVGGLMAYAADRTDMFRRAAMYVDKILKGAKPADLPVEQPTKFEFVINLKTAKQIGLIIPPNVLARADRVIK